MEMSNEGLRDEGAIGGVLALTMGDGPAIAFPECRGKRDVSILELLWESRNVLDARDLEP